MSKRNSARRKSARTPWWRRRRTRDRAWWLGAGSVALALVAGLIYLQVQAPDDSQEAPTASQTVRPFELPDVVSGQMVSLDDYLGKKEVVIVGYMGWF